MCIGNDLTISRNNKSCADGKFIPITSLNPNGGDGRLNRLIQCFKVLSDRIVDTQYRRIIFRQMESLSGHIVCHLLRHAVWKNPVIAEAHYRNCKELQLVDGISDGYRLHEAH